ncbi:LysR family transcriptional regulator [Aestuariicoccus sp. MJ-SS9]|uniref:LysR family transcriptional regulator n=1 Tax=Aestuariicoccus sp. MJ-SS9 TaxID=3079855 RepID=UPI002905FA21|nr:LysR family transcriptional regulator [Aestuariicoccus sp. MJ-SS9]MDU8910003.1 LysR family transcriptional regulator [Aestuariicoccus sp. MJ-SS9]
MDWRNLAFDWNRARAFLVTAEEGSLSAAARALGMAQPTLGRQVAAFEEELGVTLFERTGRGLTLTEAGTHLMTHMRAMGEAAAAVALAAGGQVQDISGPVAITASELYAQKLLPPVLARLRELAPGLIIEVVSSNEHRDLKRREADIAIRNGRPDQPDLIGKLVAEDRGTFYATRAVAECLGPVSGPADLARADFIGMDGLAGYIKALNAFGIPVTESHFPILAASHSAHWDMARAGLGVGVGPCWLGDADPDLVALLPQGPYIDYPVWLVAHRELRTSPRVRLVWDTLAEMLPDLLRR